MIRSKPSTEVEKRWIVSPKKLAQLHEELRFLDFTPPQELYILDMNLDRIGPNRKKEVVARLRSHDRILRIRYEGNWTESESNNLTKFIANLEYNASRVVTTLKGRRKVDEQGNHTRREIELEPENKSEQEMMEDTLLNEMMYLPTSTYVRQRYASNGMYWHDNFMWAINIEADKILAENKFPDKYFFSIEIPVFDRRREEQASFAIDDLARQILLDSEVIHSERMEDALYMD